MRPERSKRGGRVLRAVLTVAIFALLGPLVGGLVTMTGLVFIGFGPVPLGDAVVTILAMTIYGLWAAYPLGIIPATATGLVVAWLDGRGGGTTLALALLLGLGVGFISGLASISGGNRLFSDLVVASCLVATLACWLVSRPLRRLAA